MAILGQRVLPISYAQAAEVCSGLVRGLNNRVAPLDFQTEIIRSFIFFRAIIFEVLQYVLKIVSITDESGRSIKFHGCIVNLQ